MIRTAIALMLTILPLAAVETATVHRIVIDDLLADRYDVELILYERDGAFYHGYALVPEHDNLIHPVDCTPSAPYRFIDTASGEAIAIPDNMRSAYSYRNDDFNSWKDRYLRGAIAIEHTDPTTPLDPATMTGTIDVLINQVDAPNVPGRCNASRAYRLVFAGDQATSWSYAEGDENYGADAPRTQHAITHRIDDAAWQPEDADAFPAGADWPQVHGPHLNGSAIPYAGDLVANLHDARPAWVSEERIGGGRSAGFTRGDFAMAPFAWTGLGYGGYAGPAVADGRVYLHHMYADPELIAAVEGIAFGAGLSLAAACDHVVASDSARFAASFGKVGLTADCGLVWTLPQRTGLSIARDMLLTARQVAADEALRIGIIDQLVPAGGALEAALAKAAEYRPVAPLSIAAMKYAFAQGPGSLAETLSLERQQQPMLSMTQDHHEGIAAFKEKRAPAFIGK